MASCPISPRSIPTATSVFAWNGTTSGVRVPDGDWIAADRRGLTICDATSAAFAMRLPWDKLDVVTWSWQKALGGEAGHGMLALSPRAVERLESYTPALAAAQAVPADLGRQADRGHLPRRDDQHAVDAVRRGCARLAEMGRGDRRARRRSSPAPRAIWRRSPDWVGALLVAALPGRGPGDPLLHLARSWRSPSRGSPRCRRGPLQDRAVDDGAARSEGAGYDIASHRASPPGMRIWAGATVERSDVEALLPWLDWAWDEQRGAAKAA